MQSTFKGTYSKIYVNGTDLPLVRTAIAAKLKQDPSIDFNPQIPEKIKNGQLVFAIDQQPWLQGY